MRYLIAVSVALAILSWGSARSSANDLAEKLLACWDLDRTVQGIAPDTSGNGLHAQPLNGAKIGGQGRHGKALLLREEGQYLQVAASDLFRQPREQLSVAAWYYVIDPSVNAQKQVIYEEGGDAVGLSIYIYDGRLHVGAWSDPPPKYTSPELVRWPQQFVTTDKIQARRWHHVTLVIDGTEAVEEDSLRAYLDGKLIGSARAARLHGHGNPAGIGGVNGNTRFHDGRSEDPHTFVGAIDDVRLYAHALTPDEIVAVARGDGRPSPDAVARLPESLASNEPPKAAPGALPEAKRGTFTVHRESVSNASARVVATRFPGMFRSVGPAGESFKINGKPSSFELSVPDSYDPTKPAGLVVFITGGGQSGKIRGQWKPVLEKHNLIWAGPNGAGNQTDVAYRLTLALEAARVVQQDYALDPDRIYISGFSGGARMASQLGIMCPDIFSGGLYFAGVNVYPESFPVPPGKLLQLAKQRSRHVLVHGTNDDVATYVPKHVRFFPQQRFAHFTYLSVEGLGHKLPDASWFEKGLMALDAPLRAAATASFEEAKTLEKRRKLGEAALAYSRAARQGDDEEVVRQAQSAVRRLEEQYDSTLASLKAQIEAGEFATARKEMVELRGTWGAVFAEDAKRLAALIEAQKQE